MDENMPMECSKGSWIEILSIKTIRIRSPERKRNSRSVQTSLRVFLDRWTEDEVKKKTRKVSKAWTRTFDEPMMYFETSTRLSRNSSSRWTTSSDFEISIYWIRLMFYRLFQWVDIWWNISLIEWIEIGIVLELWSYVSAWLVYWFIANKYEFIW